MTYPGGCDTPDFHSLRAEIEQTSNQTEITSVDDHVHTWQDELQEFVRLGFPLCSVLTVGFGQQRCVGHGWWRSSDNDIELRVGSDQEGEEVGCLLGLYVTQESRKELLTLDRVEQRYERMGVTAWSASKILSKVNERT
jgi:hypothetical protein